jgi:hypothetical protein
MGYAAPSKGAIVAAPGGGAGTSKLPERLAKTRSDFFRRLACLRASTCCGYALVNKGTDIRIIQGYLGYRSSSSTVRYTKLDSRRFAKLF